LPVRAGVRGGVGGHGNLRPVAFGSLAVSLASPAG
jgi:hypothetical protein